MRAVRAAQCDALRLVTLFAAQQRFDVRPTLYQGLVDGAVRGAGRSVVSGAEEFARQCHALGEGDCREVGAGDGVADGG